MQYVLVVVRNFGIDTRQHLSMFFAALLVEFDSVVGKIARVCVGTNGVRGRVRNLIVMVVEVGTAVVIRSVTRSILLRYDQSVTLPGRVTLA